MVGLPCGSDGKQSLGLVVLPHPELPLHQVGSCDHLTDWMLHLQPGVHLHEVEVVLGVHYELHRACKTMNSIRYCDVFHASKEVKGRCSLTCSHVVHSLGCSDGGFSQFPPNIRTDSRLGGDSETKEKKHEDQN